MIQAVEYLCFYCGVVLFALGLISLIIKRQWRLGIIVILIADIPLATAIAFPKIIAFWCDDHNIYFNNYTGIIVGIISAIILYALLSLIFNKYLVSFFYRTKNCTKDKDSSSKKDDANTHKLNECKDNKTLNQAFANPSIFSNVKAQK